MNIKKLINESIRRVLNEKVYGKIATVFHSSRAKPDDFIPLLVGGMFQPGKGAGSMYGPGLYTVFQLKGSNTTTFAYGDFIYKLKLNLDGFVILNVEICKKVYGEALSIKEQLKVSGNQRAIKKFEDSSQYVSTLINLPLEKLEEYSQIGAWDLNPYGYDQSLQKKRMKNSKKMSIERYGFLAPRNAPFALELIADDKWRYIPGMIYVGDNDGLCALVYDANAAIPLAYTEKQPGEETGAMFLGGILADRDRDEKDHDFINIPKEKIRTAVKRVYKKGNTKDLILAPKNKKIRKYTYNEIKDLFDFPLSNNLQGGLFTIMTIKERIDYILENNPDIEVSIAALSPFKCFDIVKNSIKKSKEAFNAGKDLMIDHKSITRLTEIFGIDNYLELMLDLAIFLMKKSPNEVMGVVTNSPIMNSDFHVCLFLIYYIENRVLLPARIKKAPVERLARSARRVAISLNIAGIKLSSDIIDLLTSQFKANKGYFENILQYHTDLRKLISNQTNNNKDYSLEIFKHYADFPIVFKQFMYAQFFSTDDKIEAYRRGDENTYNHAKNKILGLS